MRTSPLGLAPAAKYQFVMQKAGVFGGRWAQGECAKDESSAEASQYQIITAWSVLSVYGRVCNHERKCICAAASALMQVTGAGLNQFC